MTNLEELEQEIFDYGIEILSFPFDSEIKGCCYQSKTGKGYICISDSVTTTKERYSILSEELGHYLTSYGNTAYDVNAENRARMNSFERSASLTKLINAYESGCSSLEDYTDYLNVTNEYLIECIHAYADRYGIEKKYKGYKLTFSPMFNIERI